MEMRDSIARRIAAASGRLGSRRCAGPGSVRGATPWLRAGLGSLLHRRQARARVRSRLWREGGGNSPAASAPARGMPLTWLLPLRAEPDQRICKGATGCGRACYRPDEVYRALSALAWRKTT